MPLNLTIDFDTRHASDADKARAEEAIHAELWRRGAHDASSARAILADEESMVAIMDIGTSALQQGWASYSERDYVSGIAAR